MYSTVDAFDSNRFRNASIFFGLVGDDDAFIGIVVYPFRMIHLNICPKFILAQQYFEIPPKHFSQGFAT